MLNLYLNTMTEIALSYGATVDKYIGDAIIAVFGDPESKGVKEDAINCVNMALEMQRTLKGMQGQLAPLRTPGATPDTHRRRYRFLHCWELRQRLQAQEYTAVGSGVNASRLETAADNGDILMSFDTYSLVSDRIPCQELDTIHLKGIGPVRTFRPVIDDGTGLSRLSLEIGTSVVNTDISQLSTEDLEAAKASLEESHGESANASERVPLKNPYCRHPVDR